jgi:hypothetical protein
VGSCGTILSSPDGKSWSDGQTGSLGFLEAVTYANGKYVTVGSAVDGSSVIKSSTDGVTWIDQPSPSTGGLFFVTYGGGQFVALGNDLICSSDGAHWTKCVSAAAGQFRSIAMVDGLAIAVGDGGAIVRSKDGVNWIEQPSASTNSLGSIVYGNGEFVVVGDSGFIATSRDGVSWVLQQSGTAESLIRIAYGDGRFVAASHRGTVVTSTDGVNWTQGSRLWVNDLLFAKGQFVAIGNDCCGGWSPIGTSSDGLNWTVRSPVTANYLRGICYGDNQFFVVGDYGTILQSDPWITLAISHEAGANLPGLSVQGPGGLRSTIQASTDLVLWREVTNAIPSGVFHPPTGLGDRMFFRAYSNSTP